MAQQPRNAEYFFNVDDVVQVLAVGFVALRDAPFVLLKLELLAHGLVLVCRVEGGEKVVTGEVFGKEIFAGLVLGVPVGCEVNGTG